MKRIVLILSVSFLFATLSYAQDGWGTGQKRPAYNSKKMSYLELSLRRRLAVENKQQQNNQAATKELIDNLPRWVEQGDFSKVIDVAERAQRARDNSVSSCGPGQIAYMWSHNGEETAVCLSPDIILRRDHLGNNLLHKAKDVKTVSAVGSVAQSFYPSDFSVIHRLQDEKNVALETPLIAHVSRGDLESFFPLYGGSSLSHAIDKQEKAGFSNRNLSSQSAWAAYQSEMKRYGTNAAGVNVAILVQQQNVCTQQTQDTCKAQTDILDFFNRHAPYLLNEKNLL